MSSSAGHPGGERLARYTWVGPGLDESGQPVGDEAIAIMIGGPDGDDGKMLEMAHWSLPQIISWSPNGGVLIVGGRSFDVVSGGGKVRTTESGQNAVWSVDGAQMVWTVRDEDQQTVVTETVMLSERGQTRELARLVFSRSGDSSPGPTWATFAPPRPRWLPDRSGLLMPVPETVDETGTWLIPLRGEPPRLSPHLLCDLSPDGSRMVLRTLDNRLVLARVEDGMVIQDLAVGIAAAWRPEPLGDPPPAPLTLRSPPLHLATPRREGSAVEELQRRLADLGYLPGSIDGVFGPRTEAAVRAFQERNGEQVDGIVGPRTWAMLRHPAPYRASED